MFEKILEGTVEIDAPIEKKISKDLPVFYNPVMKFNRDMSILLLKSVDDQSMMVCDLLAGSGIRSIRFLAELPEGKLESVTINDASADAVSLIEKNLEENRKRIIDKNTKVNITNNDATLALLTSKGFDYIDVDPFGTPDPFLDAAVKRLGRTGILAVTATDTSSLAGTYPKVCMRRYWAKPDRGSLKHEIGIRILIRKVQLIAAQYEKALVPILSYSKEHYMRIFFRCKKGKSMADQVIKQQGMFKDVGPMWLGDLWDESLVTKMMTLVPDIKYDFDARFLQMLADESKIHVVGFYDIHSICEKNKIEVPPFEPVFLEVRKRGFKLSRTHFLDYGVRTDMPEDEFTELIIVHSKADRKSSKKDSKN